MKFNIITIFPNIFDCYFNESIIKRAQEKGLIKIDIHNLRDYTTDKHKTVDDKPYGGGVGMIFKIEPIWRCINDIKTKVPPATLCIAMRAGESPTYVKTSAGKQKSKVILLSAKGKKFDQKMAKKLSKLDEIILICGRYEGVDERVAKYIADEEISIGDYVLTGGEIPAMILVDAVSRLIPDVLGKKESLLQESFSREKYLEYPQYTRPDDFMGWKVPKMLLSGNHKKIEEWKEGKLKVCKVYKVKSK